jgi:uncharacterized protein with von Willebrand factor type A (vWA) domain
LQPSNSRYKKYVGSSKELSPPWQHNTALRQAADGGDSLQMCPIAAKRNDK